MSKKDELNISLSLIMVLQEVQMRLIDTQVDNPELKQMLKSHFNSFRKEGLKLNKTYRKVYNTIEREEDPEELYDCDADFYYDLVTKSGLVSVDEKDHLLEVLKTMTS